MGEGGLVDSDAELRRTLFIGGRRLHELESFLQLLSYCSQLYRLRVVDYEYIVVPLTRKSRYTSAARRYVPGISDGTIVPS